MKTRSSLADLFVDPGSSTPAIVSTSPLVVVNYEALAEQVERPSGRLRNAGLKPGECVAIALPNSLEFLLVFLALTHARLVAVPINPADKPDEIRFFIKDAKALAVVAEGANIVVREAITGLGLPMWQPRVDTRGVVELPDLPMASRASIDAPSPDHIALLAYTSGTTGRRRPDIPPLPRDFDPGKVLKTLTDWVLAGNQLVFSSPSGIPAELEDARQFAARYGLSVANC
jgi:acyl-CoA synthetase (AMP-forming)/AMP-acid ligase II